MVMSTQTPPSMKQRAAMKKGEPRRFASTNHAAARSVNPMDHLGLVKTVANRIADVRGETSRGDEWIGLCWEWLIKCCAKFDQSNGAAFSTYYVRSCFRNAHKFESSGGDRKKTRVSISTNGKKYTKYVWRQHEARLYRNDGSDKPLSCRHPTPLQEVMERDDAKDLYKRLKHYLNVVLDDTQRDMVRRRVRGETLDEVARVYGVTREGIRKRCNTAGYFDDPDRVLRAKELPT